MADITIIGVPETVTEQELKEWCAILIERKENQKLEPPKVSVDAAKTLIDKFRTDNSLTAKYTKEEVEPVIEQPIEPK